jgi:hypothetical protein
MPALHSGGPGERFVKISIEGVPGYEIDFRFLVHGEYKNKAFNETENEV